MKKEVRTVVFDQDLKIEAYRFEGVMQKFPNHFHEHYVVGFIERGARLLTAGNREYTAVPGDLLLFNPRDAHTCQQVDGEALDYRCLNIGTEVMAAAAAEVTGRRFEPFFRERAARGGEELLSLLGELHAMIIEGGCTLKKEELYYVFMGELINNFASEKRPRRQDGGREEAAAVCGFIEERYAENITLEQLGGLCGLNKYNLLRLFAREKGITPYGYLETVRINRAKALLESGESPAEAALKTGFSDQSHFTNFFKKFIGLTPKQYGKIFNMDGNRQGVGV